FAYEMPLELVDRVEEPEALLGRPVQAHHKAEPFVPGGKRAILGGSRRREPSLVQTAPLGSKCVIVVWMQLDSPSGYAEAARHPCRNETEYTLPLFECHFDDGCFQLNPPQIKIPMLKTIPLILGII